MKKIDLPTHKIRNLLEPGPIVLVSSSLENETNIMTMGWYTVMEFTPALVGCIISADNYSFNMIRKSGECVINLPTADMIKKVVAIGNIDGNEVDKFKKFKLTPVEAKKVDAPLIKECYANFECKIYDTRLIYQYNFFIFKVVRAIKSIKPKNPKTIHYAGGGNFMVSGKHMNLKKLLKREYEGDMKTYLVVW